MTAKRLVPSFVRTIAVSLGSLPVAPEVMAVLRAREASGAIKLVPGAAAPIGEAGK